MNSLNLQDSVRRWQAFIAEDRQTNSSRNNLLFLQLDFASVHASVAGGGGNGSLQYNFDVPGDINTLRQYWVQVGNFDENQIYMANVLLPTLRRYFPAAVIADREGSTGISAFRIGPFQNAADATMFVQAIGDSRSL
jgi:hypothetical protein